METNEMSENLRKLTEFLDSPEGKEQRRLWIEKEKQKEQTLTSQLERFHSKYGDKLDVAIERIKAKYESDAYRDREFYKHHREPMESLYSFLFTYAIRYSKRCYEKQYYNDFTGDVYYLGSYIIQIMHGQGSVIHVDKQNNPPIINEPTPRMNEFLQKVDKLCFEFGYTIKPNDMDFNDEHKTLLVSGEGIEIRLTSIDGDGLGK